MTTPTEALAKAMDGIVGGAGGFQNLAQDILAALPEGWALVSVEDVSIDAHVARMFRQGKAHAELGNDWHTCTDECIGDILGLPDTAR